MLASRGGVDRSQIRDFRLAEHLKAFRGESRHKARERETRAGRVPASDDALELFTTLRARVMLPSHWGTFNHVTSTAHDAINRLRLTLEQHGDRDRVHIVEPGETLIAEPEAPVRIVARG